MLLARLLADDALIAQQEREVAHHVVDHRCDPRHDERHGHEGGEHAEAPSARCAGPTRRRAGASTDPRGTPGPAVVGCAASRSSPKLLKDGRQLRLEVGHAAVVDHRERRPPCFLLLRELPRDPLVDELVPAVAGTLAAQRLRSDDGDRTS